MKRLLSCEFNFDTVCVELKFSDDTMIAIDTIAVEKQLKMRWRTICISGQNLTILSTMTRLHTPI